MKSQFSLFAVFLFVYKVVCYDFSETMKNRLISQGHDPDIFRNVSELISSKGYPVKNHIVQTTDGYLLPLQRIPYGINEPNGENRPVVFLVHAALSTSANWVWNSPERSLGFILADNGYDVWLGNLRGNTYAKKHIKFKPSMKQFWDFSFDEMAEYDLPASIDYILHETGQEQLSYIGHSLGTTSILALLSENPLYNEKIKIFVALAPTTTHEHAAVLSRYFLEYARDFHLLLEFLGIYELFPSNALTKFISVYVCDSQMWFICEALYSTIFRPDRKELDKDRLGVYFANTPAGSSLKTFAHYGQMVKSKIFRKFDYGLQNMEFYNQDTPPQYDVSKITTPTAIFWARNDGIAVPVDVNILQKKLKYLIVSYQVPYAGFTHEDFVWAIDAPKLVYNKILSLLEEYN